MRTPLFARTAGTLAVLAAGSAPIPSMAQAPEGKSAENATTQGAGDWRVRLGGLGEYEPDYEGSDDYELNALPLVSLRYRDLFYVQGPEIGVNLLPGNERFRLLANAKYTWERDEDDNPALHGLGDIDGGFAAGLRGEYDLLPVTFVVEVDRDVSGVHDGLRARLGANVGVPLSQRLKARLGIYGTWADDDYMSAYYGIDAAQSAASGLPQHEAGAGVKDAETALELSYEFTPRWSVDMRGAYSRLLGEAADSPIVDGPGSPDQFTFRVGLSYGFSLGR